MVKITPVAILSVLELVLNIIIAGLISQLSGCYVISEKDQFVAGIVYGFLIINVVLVAGIFIDGEINRTLRMILSGVGSILWLAAAALCLEAGDNWCRSGEQYDRMIAAGVLGLAICISMGVKTFFTWRQTGE